jgi:hypothetical protein
MNATTAPRFTAGSDALHAHRHLAHTGLLRLAQYMRERWRERARTADDAAAQRELGEYLFDRDARAQR